MRASIIEKTGISLIRIDWQNSYQNSTNEEEIK